MIKQRLTITLCLLLASLVFMSSLHMVQVFGAAIARSATNDDGLTHGHAKIAPDLHHHMDKSGIQLVKDAGDNQLFADYRTLRALRNAKRDLPYRYRLASWFQDSWLQLTTMCS